MRHVEMAFGAARIARTCATKKINCLCVPRRLQSDDAGKMQRIEVASVQRERIAAQALGLACLTGPIMLECRREKLIGHSHCKRGITGTLVLLAALCRAPLPAVHDPKGRLLLRFCRAGRPYICPRIGCSAGGSRVRPFHRGVIFPLDVLGGFFLLFGFLFLSRDPAPICLPAPAQKRARPRASRA